MIPARAVCIIVHMTAASGLRKLPVMLIIASILLFALTGCESAENQLLEGDSAPDAAGDVMTFSAEVKWIPLEGGFYGLVTEDGRRYLPLNLPEEYKQDGLTVWVRGKPTDTATVQMWGTPIEIYEIKIDTEQ